MADQQKQQMPSERDPYEDYIEPHNTERVGFADFADLFSNGKNLPPIDTLWPGFVAGSVGMLTAAGGVGKSMFALQAAADMASGANLLGLGVKPGKVLMLSGEDAFETIAPRIVAIGDRLSISQQERLAANFKLAFTVGLGLNTSDRVFMRWLTKLAAGSDLLVLDTISRFHLYDENKNSEMVLFMNALEMVARNCKEISGVPLSILCLHHSNKSMAMAGRGDEQQSARGASVLIDNARWAGFISTMTKPEAIANNITSDRRGFYCKFGISKQNYGAPIPELWYERKAGGMLVPVSIGSNQDEAIGCKSLRPSQYEQGEFLSMEPSGIVEVSKRKRKGAKNGF
jgi:regulatory protein RepA